MTDYIKLDAPEKKDNIIRQTYIPKEIVGIIQKEFMSYCGYNHLTRSERLLIWEFSNGLIRWFKDD